MNNETVKRLEETVDAKSDLFLQAGDVLVERSNTIDLVGTTAVFIGPSGVYVYPDLMMRMRFGDEATAHWYWRYANSANGRRFFIAAAAGSSGSMPKISGNNLRRMPLPIPPLPEQRAIAAALSDLDALLGILDRLIAKKCDLKQAAMQQLLTGQRRLPGFEGEWEVKELGDLIVLLSGHHVLARYCNTQSGIPYLTGPSDFPQGRIRITKWTSRPTTTCLANDILATVKGSGSGTIVLADGEYCISRQLMAIRVRDGHYRFFYYSLLQSGAKFKAASTGLIPGLSRADLLDQPLPLPPTLDEQAAIADVLSDMESELSLLEARRAKTRSLKQAMMQELLTGKTRLVPTGATDV